MEELKSIMVECPECNEMNLIPFKDLNFNLDTDDWELSGCNHCGDGSANVEVEFEISCTCPDCENRISMTHTETLYS